MTDDRSNMPPSAAASPPLIRAALKDAALLADIAAARDEPDALHIWWLGQSGFLIQHADRHLLFDPYLSDSLTRKYADTDKPHERMTEQVIDPARLDMIDIVTSSHNHTDHLDGDTLTALMRVNPQLSVVVPAANRAFAAKRLEVDEQRLTPIDVDAPIDVKSMRLHAVPAAHETLDTDDHGRFTHIGVVAQLGAWTVYHSGDTIRYDGMAERLHAFDIDVAMLPINGRAPQRRVSGNLWGPEAAQLAHDINARLVIPCHYDMFTFNTATPDAFVTACEQLGQTHVVLRNGQRHTLQPLAT